jgi:hypothetical protein
VKIQKLVLLKGTFDKPLSLVVLENAGLSALKYRCDCQISCAE